MNFRVFFAITQAWHFRRQLKPYLYNSNLQLENIRDINPTYLTDAKVKALVLDYDGVLAAHGEIQPRPEIISWLRLLVQAYAPHKIYVLSNKPTPERLEYFAQYFPTLDFVVAPRKKPYPDGMQEIIKISGLLPSEIMLVDDRLLTGILAAQIVGAQARWITDPYINIKARPVVEIGIIMLRYLDRLLVNILN